MEWMRQRVYGVVHYTTSITMESLNTIVDSIFSELL